MSLWRPFPPGAQALVPPGFLVTCCSLCGRGVVDAADGDAWERREYRLGTHADGHALGLARPVLIGLSERDLVLNVAASLDTAARAATNPVVRIRGIRQARSLRWPWLAWLWELLPERPAQG